ncbi:dienelactone hydrolase family protein [Pseudomonas sp. MAP12]|uniref:Dienelactone hydrolase family protein n=1 Tax=Geopseudomonas aromaticivorans TaxID=2849492 RepID=A0ABS6MT54_9GAMM|nr:alpha/beta family hydrolase [Pseudomonas aromaticivorans]MBV2131982.1 dienelactone hydrolase family protein [Pseudomonas aromaticivorans]
MSKIPKPAQRSLSLEVGDVLLQGDLTLPDAAEGLVLFAHGSGSSRFSPRNQQVARYFNDLGLATLLLDLLTEDEQDIDEVTRQFRFDIALLARRLTGVLDWLQQTEQLQELVIGLFGASTGAAAALICAAQRHHVVAAVVSRGGRTDLAGDALEHVHAPSLLIVGGEDDEVLALNRASLAQLTGIKRLEVVPGATHLFEEPGKLLVVAELAGEWFLRYLRQVP